MDINIGDLVSDWPYGQPWPNYGVVIDQKEDKKIIKVSWFPSGECIWVNSFVVTKIKETDKIIIRGNNA